MFLAMSKKVKEEHEKASDDMLELLTRIEDKKSGVAKDATMLLRWHREIADVCKRMIRQYG